MKNRIILKSNHIFDGKRSSTFKGYIVIEENSIVDVQEGTFFIDNNDSDFIVKDFSDNFIMPGVIDTHTFFSGYALYDVGLDFSNVKSNEEAKKLLDKEVVLNKTIYGHGYDMGKWDFISANDFVENSYPNIPIMIFSKDRDTCVMNKIAEKEYGFNANECYPEAYYKAIKDYLNDKDFISDEFDRYCRMLNSKGVTTVKEMGFDDFYGFTDFLKERDESKQMNMRFFFMSQPVGEKMNLEYALKMRSQFQSDRVRFSGFNLMTDGTIASHKGDLKENYVNKDYNCLINIDYDQIEKDVLAADKHGFRYTLHAQGDGAINKILNIYNKCEMDNGILRNRHGITDLEFSDPVDIEEMGKLGVLAEVYFQIMSLDNSKDLLSNIENSIGFERAKYYWNRRKMIDCGVCVSGATDLPLLITDIPESLYFSTYGKLVDFDGSFQVTNTLSANEILSAWTMGGAKNIGMENKLGSIEIGKLADIVVFDKNLLKISPDELLSAKVIMTMMDGKIVFKGE